MEGKILAFDSSTKVTAWSLYQDGKLAKYSCIRCTEKEMTDRFKTMSLRILDVIEKVAPDIIYVEDTVVVRGAQTQRFLTRLQGVIYSYCLRHDCEFYAIRPTSWRKIVGINQSKKKRKELKQEAIDMVNQRIDIGNNDDIAEAILIGYAALKNKDSDIQLEEVLEDGTMIGFSHG